MTLCMSPDLIDKMSYSNCRRVPGNSPQALETKSHKGASAPLWLGIKSCGAKVEIPQLNWK